MRILLEEDLAWCTTLDEVQQQTQSTLQELHDDGFTIGYIAGPISCDWEEQIPANIERLLAARTAVMRELGARSLVFTAPFIFSLDPNHNSYARLGLFDMDRRDREAALQSFWDELIESGQVDQVHLQMGGKDLPGHVASGRLR